MASEPICCRAADRVASDTPRLSRESERKRRQRCHTVHRLAAPPSDFRIIVDEARKTVNRPRKSPSPRLTRRTSWCGCEAIVMPLRGMEHMILMSGRYAALHTRLLTLRRCRGVGRLKAFP